MRGNWTFWSIQLTFSVLKFHSEHQWLNPIAFQNTMNPKTCPFSFHPPKAFYKLLHNDERLFNFSGPALSPIRRFRPQNQKHTSRFRFFLFLSMLRRVRRNKSESNSQTTVTGANWWENCFKTNFVIVVVRPANRFIALNDSALQFSGKKVAKFNLCLLVIITRRVKSDCRCP